MILDLVVLCILAVCAFSGYRAGLLNQVFRVVRLVGVIVLMGPTSKPVESVLADRWSFSVVVTHILAIVAGAIIAYVILSIVLWRLERWLGRDESGAMKPWNRKAGMWLGGAKGAIVVFLILCILDGLSDSMHAVFPRFYETYDHSLCGVVVAWYNPFRDFRVVDDLRALHYAMQHPSEFRVIQNDERFRALMNYPKFKELLDDRKFRNALESKDYYALLRDPRLVELIRDREFLKLLRGALDAVRERREEIREAHAGVFRIA